MLKWFVRIMLLMLAASLHSGQGTAAPELARPRPTIAFITPSSPGNTYWPSVFHVIDAVAARLDFEFIHYDIGVSDRFVIEETARKILNSKKKPDALVISVVIGNAKPILELAEKVKVPIILLGPIFPIELKSLGYNPRAKFKYWIASLDQNEPLKGYLSAKILFTKAIQEKARREARTLAKPQPEKVSDPGKVNGIEKDKDKKIQLLALGGKRWWIGSLQRDEGMNKALSEFPSIELMQMVPSDWDTKAAQNMTQRLLTRFPDADLVWAASDQMAEGAVLAFEGRTGPNKNRPFLVSGIDMSEFGLKNVKSGRTVGSASMSIVGMGEMMLYIYDYLQGYDFANEIGVNITPETVVATQETVQKHLDFFKNVDKIDFRQFSKAYNPSLKKYDFSMTTLNEAIEKSLKATKR